MKNDKFGDRVKAALLAKTGTGTAARLAKECKVSRSTAQGWLEMGEATLQGLHLPVLKRALDVRVSWLLEGELPVRARIWRGLVAQRAAAILDALTKKQCEAWLALGEKMARK